LLFFYPDAVEDVLEVAVVAFVVEPKTYGKSFPISAMKVPILGSRKRGLISADESSFECCVTK
jgi:hypothetical protein